MRPSQWNARTWIVIGLAASFAVGLAAAGPLWTAPPPGADSWTVGISHEGDRIVYAWLVEADEATDPALLVEDSQGARWKILLTVTFDVLGESTARDVSGEERPSLDVRIQYASPQTCGDPTGEDVDRPGPTHTTTAPDGSIIQSVGPTHVEYPPGRCGDVQEIRGGAIEHCGLADRKAFRSEGLGPGANVPNHLTGLATVSFLESRCSLPGAGVQETLLAVDGPGASTLRSGTIDGEPAIGIVDPGWFKLLHRPGAYVSEGRTAETVEWHHRETPYPVLIESWETFAPAGAEPSTETFRLALASFIPGDGPAVGWKEPLADAAPQLERAPQGTDHPVDGAGSSLPWPLASALALADTDPGFASWRAAHPDAVLIGGTFLEEHTDASGTDARRHEHRWQFAWGDPTGGVYHLSLVQSIDPAGAAHVEAGKEEAAARFHPEQLPAQPPTLAAVEALWRLHAKTDRPANHVSFGATHWWPDDRYPERALKWGPGNMVVEGGDWRHASLQWGGPGGVFKVTVGRVDEPHCAEACVMGGSDTFTLVGHDEAGQWDFRDIDAELAAWEPDEEWRQGKVLAAFSYPAFRPPVVATIGLVSGGAFLLFLAAYLWPALKYASAHAYFAVPGFSRVDRDGLVEQKTRDALCEAISAEPGLSATDLHRRLGIGWGTTVYHLTRLERAKLVMSVHDGRHRRFFPIGALDWSRRGAAALLRNDRAREIHDLISGDPGIAQSGIAGAVGLARPTVAWHLHRLEGEGLVARVKRGRSVHYYANPEPEVRSFDPKESVEVA